MFKALLTKIWCGELSVNNPVWRVLVCMVFFPLISTEFLTFRSDLKSQRVFRNVTSCMTDYLYLSLDVMKSARE